MRIRAIKPEFWRSDDIDALSLEDRLLFIGLWSYVDDSGVGLDRESSIAADLFAGDLARDFRETSLRVHGGLKRLFQAGLVLRYEVKGKRYIHVVKFGSHQKINRPTASRLPPPTSPDAKPHVPLTEDSVNPPVKNTLGTGEQGNRGTGEITELSLRSSSGAEAPRADPDRITAQTVAAVWVDSVRANGTDPSKAQIGQVARYAKELLGRNHPDRVLAAARDAGAKGYVQIDRELTVMNGRAAAAPTRIPTTTQRLTAIDNLKQPGAAS